MMKLFHLFHRSHPNRDALVDQLEGLRQQGPVTMQRARSHIEQYLDNTLSEREAAQPRERANFDTYLGSSKRLRSKWKALQEAAQARSPELGAFVKASSTVAPVPWHTMPRELKRIVAMQCTPRDLGSLARTSRDWRSVIDDDHVWRECYGSTVRHLNYGTWRELARQKETWRRNVEKGRRYDEPYWYKILDWQALPPEQRWEVRHASQLIIGLLEQSRYDEAAKYIDEVAERTRPNVPAGLWQSDGHSRTVLSLALLCRDNEPWGPVDVVFNALRKAGAPDAALNSTHRSE